MGLIEKVHGDFIYKRRLNVLCERLTQLLPVGASVLDVGSGDGLLAHLIQLQRPDLDIRGLDVLVREKTFIPITRFDGKTIPGNDRSFDVVTLVDVLHHTDDPFIMLKEAVRVARLAVIIKDHCCDGLAAFRTLKFMDRVGNKRYGVTLPHNYWPEKKWRETFRELGLVPASWASAIGLYPFPLNLVFDRSLHFITKLQLPSYNLRE